MQIIKKFQENDLNLAELSTILYYADFLSLKHACRTVTDTCKYFFIHNTPINIAYIVGNTPVYDAEDQFFKLSRHEYTMLRDKFGEEGVLSFVDNICNLSAVGAVNATQMLKCIHLYSTRELRNDAFRKYKHFKTGIKYTTTINDENGDEIEIECSKYVAHANAKAGTGKPQIHYGA